MLHHRSLVLGGVAGFSLALFCVAFVSCQKKKDDQVEAKDRTAQVPAPGLPAQTTEELATPLATVDDVVISVGEFQDRINRQSPYIRARYTSLEQKKEFLDTLIRFEVLAKEAMRRGFDKDPEVVRTMKQVMIQKLMKDEFENKIKQDDIPEEEMLAFYKEHEAEYNKPEEVRVAAIILKDKAQAEKAAAAARGDKGKTNPGFRELVTQYSTDEETKARGGDLRYFGRDSEDIPKPVIEASFALQRTGEVAGPIDAGNGTFYVLKQTGKRRALTKKFEDVKRQIRNRIYRDKRTQSQRDFLTNLRANAKVEILEGNLDKVRIDTSASPHGGEGGMHGAPAFPEEADK